MPRGLPLESFCWVSKGAPNTPLVKGGVQCPDCEAELADIQLYKEPKYIGAKRCDFPVLFVPAMNGTDQKLMSTSTEFLKTATLSCLNIFFVFLHIHYTNGGQLMYLPE
jgi:hypothetical protein